MKNIKQTLSLLPIIIIGLMIVRCSQPKQQAIEAFVAPIIDSAGLYQANCSRCHGVNGSGGTAPDLTKVKLTETTVEWRMKLGFKDPPMPSFKKMSPDSIRYIAGYVMQHFQHDSTPVTAHPFTSADSSEIGE